MFKTKKVLEQQKEKIEKLEEEKDLIEEEKFESLDIANNLYEELQEEDSIIRDKEEKIEKIQSENNEIKEKNQILEELHGNSTPNWQVNIDIAWIINPLTKKQEKYKIPKNIKIDKVENLDLSDDLKWVSFTYDDEKYKNKEFNIPRSLGEQLKIITPLNNKNQDKIDINEIKDIEDIKNILDSRGINTNLEYWQSSIEYLIYCRGAKFRTIEFQKACKFKNRESARKYLNRLIETGLIKRVGKGVYEVLFNFE